MQKCNDRGLTLVEFIVVVVVIAIVLFVLLDLTPHRHHRQSALRAVDMSNLRQVAIELVAYGADNGGYPPGLNPLGEIDDASVENRYRLMIESDYLHADSLISRYEDDMKIMWTTGALTNDHYSYAMLQLAEGGMRLTSWHEDAGAEAAWASGRNTGTDAAAGINSLQADEQGTWRGPVAWADGHVTREDDQFVDTRYQSDGPVNMDDNLFEAAGDDDAYMIYEGD